MSDEFSAELIDRCVQAHSEVVTNHGLPGYHLSAADVITVLRASKYAELVAALKQFADPNNWSDEIACRHAIGYAESVLKTVGEK